MFTNISNGAPALLQKTAFLQDPEFGPWNPSKEEYHADHRYFNHSWLEIFRKSVPLFYARYITGTLESRPPTEAMDLGSAVHSLLLEPNDAEGIVVMPELNLRTAAGRTERAAFEEQHQDCLVLTAEQYETAQAMAAAVTSNATAKRLLEAPGLTEHALRWPCSRTGLPLKARLDKVIENREGVLEGSAKAVIVEIKTTLDPYPEAWPRTVLHYGYHRQAAFYQRAWREMHDVVPEVFFVVVGKSAPFETVVYHLTEPFLRLGAEENDSLLHELCDRIEMDDWAGRFSDAILPLAPPRWALAAWHGG